LIFEGSFDDSDLDVRPSHPRGYTPAELRMRDTGEMATKRRADRVAGQKRRRALAKKLLGLQQVLIILNNT
jgi:hypothetical protein